MKYSRVMELLIIFFGIILTMWLGTFGVEWDLFRIAQMILLGFAFVVLAWITYKRFG